jgi:thioredoxin 1
MVIKLTDSDFEDEKEKIMKQGRGLLVLFWAEWCPFCVSLCETFKELEEDYGDKLTFAETDNIANRETSKRYNVTGVPTVIAFKHSEIMDIRPGFREVEQYIEMAERLI